MALAKLSTASHYDLHRRIIEFRLGYQRLVLSRNDLRLARGASLRVYGRCAQQARQLAAFCAVEQCHDHRFSALSACQYSTAVLSCQPQLLLNCIVLSELLPSLRCLFVTVLSCLATYQHWSTADSAVPHHCAAGGQLDFLSGIALLALRTSRWAKLHAGGARSQRSRHQQCLARFAIRVSSWSARARS